MLGFWDWEVTEKENLKRDCWGKVLVEDRRASANCRISICVANRKVMKIL